MLNLVDDRMTAMQNRNENIRSIENVYDLFMRGLPYDNIGTHDHTTSSGCSMKTANITEPNLLVETKDVKTEVGNKTDEVGNELDYVGNEVEENMLSEAGTKYDETTKDEAGKTPEEGARNDVRNNSDEIIQKAGNQLDERAQNESDNKSVENMQIEAGDKSDEDVKIDAGTKSDENIHNDVGDISDEDIQTDSRSTSDTENNNHDTNRLSIEEYVEISEGEILPFVVYDEFNDDDEYQDANDSFTLEMKLAMQHNMPKEDEK